MLHQNHRILTLVYFELSYLELSFISWKWQHLVGMLHVCLLYATNHISVLRERQEKFHLRNGEYSTYPQPRYRILAAPFYTQYRWLHPIHKIGCGLIYRVMEGKNLQPLNPILKLHPRVGFGL